MKNLDKLLPLALFFIFHTMSSNAMNAPSPSQWDSWQQFKQYYLSQDGRVIDFQPNNQITTSEGQSYALFFALVANDKESFDIILQWTIKNLAHGNINTHLPAWIWGQDEKKKWKILDNNSASDADTWIAYDLLEAGRLWHNARYTKLGKNLLNLIKTKEVVTIPGIGMMLLPAPSGFVHPNTWTMNPSYLPLQLFTRFSQIDPDWMTIKNNSFKLLIDTSPLGFSPDWAIWEKNAGWQLDTPKTDSGSYNAIRVYLWLGLLPDNADGKAKLISHFEPMLKAVSEKGMPPEVIDIVKGTFKGTGPVGFSAALLPLLIHTEALTNQQQRVESFSLSSREYYNAVLTLFGLGSIQLFFQFNQQGQVVPFWSKSQSIE